MASTTKEPLRDGDVSDMELDELDKRIALIEEILGDSGSETPITSTKNSAGNMLSQATPRQTDKKANDKELGNNLLSTPEVLEVVKNSNSVECDRCALKRIPCVLAKQTADQGKANLACMACYINRSKCHWQHTAVKKLAYQQLDESGLNMRQSGPSSSVPEEVQHRFTSTRVERNASIVKNKKNARFGPIMQKVSQGAASKGASTLKMPINFSSGEEEVGHSRTVISTSQFIALSRLAVRLEIDKLKESTVPEHSKSIGKECESGIEEGH
ncbi:hypothetical protein FRC14_007956 [Serendipita sp. 396]|nr:hypothetical protein FRC14_007956 [Serendipita sp. 396]KAG8783785.1 hypothetical protein FRC15_004545 [Serendipita sp. 397]KAG8793333.1 hypothetical protein FRC16_011005 [Serendipita sp. 398]KAG8867684.1 hypothetical protein FRC20_005145 [Serendipita sp. 405]